MPWLQLTVTDLLDGSYLYKCFFPITWQHSQIIPGTQYALVLLMICLGFGLHMAQPIVAQKYNI